jgi:flotillin
MARMMPPMMQVMKDVGGVEVPEYLAKLTGDAPKVVDPATNGHAQTPAGTSRGA